MTPLLLFCSTFLLVFCLGLQSLIVNHGYYFSAFINSLMIGSCNLMLYKLAPNASGWEIAGFLGGGPFGIVFAMIVFKRVHFKLSMNKV